MVKFTHLTLFNKEIVLPFSRLVVATAPPTKNLKIWTVDIYYLIRLIIISTIADPRYFPNIRKISCLKIRNLSLFPPQGLSLSRKRKIIIMSVKGHKPHRLSPPNPHPTYLSSPARPASPWVTNCPLRSIRHSIMPWGPERSFHLASSSTRHHVTPWGMRAPFHLQIWLNPFFSLA